MRHPVNHVYLINKLTEKTIKLFKWYYDLLPLFGSSRLVTGIGHQSSANPVLEANASPAIVRSMSPCSNDFDADEDDIFPVSEHESEPVSASVSAPVSAPSGTQASPPILLNRQNRIKKRNITDVLSEYYDEQSKSSAEYVTLIKKQKDHHDQDMRLKRFDYILKLKDELRREDIGDEDREEIRMMIADTKKYDFIQD